MYTNSKEFNESSIERKIELIEIDSFNLLLKYLSNEIDLKKLLDEIDKLSLFKLVTKSDLLLFLNGRIKYEAYLAKFGKNINEVQSLKNRMITFNEFVSNNHVN